MPISLTMDVVGAVATVVVPVAGAAVVYMRMAMGYSIRGLKLDLFKDLNGTYTRRGECFLVHTDLKNRLERMEGEMNKVERDVSKMDRHLGRAGDE